MRKFGFIFMILIFINSCVNNENDINQMISASEIDDDLDSLHHV